MDAPTLQQSPTWQALQAHYNETNGLHMREQFASDSGRFTHFSLSIESLLFDYSKNRIDENTKRLLIDLAREAQLETAIKAMFSGKPINKTENRAVLHTALRNRDNRPIFVDGEDVMPKVNAVLAKMTDFCKRIQSGEWQGYTGKPIKNIVNIGIGGSDLGPKMVTHALKPYWLKGLSPQFVANIDGADLLSVLDKINPETTLFIIASKTFTTKETMANAIAARQWFLDQCGGELSHIEKHFIALSSARKEVEEFGIDPQNMFEFWDWVGGRYSLWSCIGLPIALMIGMEHFEALLAGAHTADQHFMSAPFEENIPVMMAMLGIWYRNFYGAASHAILPYDHNLRLLPSYLQQSDMESNGKAVRMEGQATEVDTGPIIWGGVGSNAQHAFFQLLHQGTQLVPADFILAANSHSDIRSDASDHHRLLCANCLAQSEALMRGRDLQNVAAEMSETPSLIPHRSFDGNRPNNTFIVDELDPYNLGMLIALYEHKIFAQGVIWDINSFDQWGVELGKKLAVELEHELSSEATSDAHDGSTTNLLNHLKKKRRR